MCIDKLTPEHDLLLGIDRLGSLSVLLEDRIKKSSRRVSRLGPGGVK